MVKGKDRPSVRDRDKDRERRKIETSMHEWTKTKGYIRIDIRLGTYQTLREILDDQGLY